MFLDGPRSPSTSLELASVDGDEVYQFDASGRHQATVSSVRGKPREALSYTSGQLASITDGGGNMTTIDRSTPGKVKIIGPFNSETTTLTLDGNGYLSAVDTPNAEHYAMMHSTTGLLVSYQTPDDYGASVGSSFQYDAAGYLIHDTDALTGSTGQSLVQAGNANGLGYNVSLTTAQGLLKKFGMDFSTAAAPTGSSNYPGPTAPVADQTQLRTFVSPAGLTNQDKRLTDGSRIVSLVDGTLSWTQFLPDPRFGNAMQYVSGSTIRKGSTHTRIESVLKAATLSSATDPLSTTSLTTTDCVNGTGGATTCTGGNKTSTVFTSSTNMEVTTLPSSRTIQRVFDSEDRVTSVQVMGTTPVTLNAVSYSYDTHGRLNEISTGSRSYTTSFDSTTGFVSGLTEAVSGTAISTTTNTTWDGDGRPTATTLPGGYSLGRTYDADGNLFTLSTPNSNMHDLLSNAVDLLSTYTPPSSGAPTGYNYDFDHNLAALLDPDGTAVYYRDAAGRMYSDGTASKVYSATTGLLSYETAGTEKRTYGYDGPLVSSVTIVSTGTPSYSHAITLTHDNFFRVTGRQLDSLSNIAYGYDADSNLTSVGALTINRGSGSSSNGMVVSTTMTGGIVETPTFDAYGALSNDAYGSVYSVAYTRGDGSGRVTQKVETISGTATTWTYVYDGQTGCPTTAVDGRLCTATATVAGSTTFGPYTYTYDSDGNRTDLTNSYDAQDRMGTFGSASYTYTPGGRLLTKTDSGTTYYTYDVFDNLTTVTLPSTTIVGFANDAQHRRVARTIAGTAAQEFLYDDVGHLVAELDGSGNVVSQFIYGTKSNVPDYMINTISGASTTYRLITDQLGSVVMVVNATSPTTIAQQLTYDPWGNILTHSDISNGNTMDVAFQPFGFAGGIQDRETGLVRFGARDYDPSTGRWTTKDPTGFDSGELNFYRYSGSDPINLIDPDGYQYRSPTPDLLRCAKVPQWSILKRINCCREECDKLLPDPATQCPSDDALARRRACIVECRSQPTTPEP